MVVIVPAGRSTLSKSMMIPWLSDQAVVVVLPMMVELTGSPVDGARCWWGGAEQ